MAAKSPFALKPHLFVLVHTGDGNPYAARLNLRKVSRMFLATGFTLTLASVGSLLFFRELELNRKLQDRLLELETREKIAAAGPAPSVPAPRIVAAKEPPPAEVPIVENDSIVPGMHASGGVARIADINAECVADECQVKFAMVPVQPGTAQGQLLVILETEVPRIGTGNPTTQVRKRYFIYPGNEARDELTQSQLVTLPRKPFRCSRALQTSARFKIAKLLRPLAVNIYLFDRKQTLLTHERKVIETED
jgi:hypothetical protein